MSKKQQKGVGFAFRAIQTVQFATFPDIYDEDKDVGFWQSYEYGADPNTHFIGVLTEFRFTHGDTPFLTLKVSCHFEIKEEAWQTMQSEDGQSITIEPGFLGHLQMLTIGTCRGVLHAKTENTEFNQYLLPTINVAELIKEPVTIEFKGERSE